MPGGLLPVLAPPASVADVPPPPLQRTASQLAAPLRWGILGAAQIARKFARAVLASPGSTLSAVASRDANRARALIDELLPAHPGPAPEAS